MSARDDWQTLERVLHEDGRLDDPDDPGMTALFERLRSRDQQMREALEDAIARIETAVELSADVPSGAAIRALAESLLPRLGEAVSS